ncbi:MAG TPA: hypothetical protein VL728_06685 [Cyclobacteriaceae bacterium]|nr:hypothetical protein [Cyclobacteriaceae bacterium]
MKKRLHGKKLETMLESIHQKNPKGLLVIESEFEIYLTNYESRLLLPDVVIGKLSNLKVVFHSIAATQKVIRLAQRDISNIRKCSSFILWKFPHAYFSSGDFSIGVHNLSPAEIKRCMAQKGMRFTYYDN